MQRWMQKREKCCGSTTKIVECSTLQSVLKGKEVGNVSLKE